MAIKTKTITPSAVSRELRQLGFTVIPDITKREGIQVKLSALGSTMIVASFDSPVTAVRRATEVEKALNEAGYNATRSDQIVYVGISFK